MKSTFTAWMTKALSAGLTATVFALPLNAQPNDFLEELTAMAARATTSAQHANVAQRYRQQSETLAAQAAEHEKEVAQQMRTVNAMSQKFRGMSSRSVQSHKAKAMEARRAAQEAATLANHHERLSLEVVARAGE